MYLEHFGLMRPPFKITPDTSLFYSGGKRGPVLDALVYAVTSGEGITKVVGEVGSGKTMLCRMLETRLPPTVEIVYIANPSLSPDNILQVIAYELGLEEAVADKFSSMQRLQERLLQLHGAGKQVVVFIEEAQCMPLATLEEIRLLSNLETGDSKLLQMVLFGQPELDIKLDQTSIRQLRERISHSFYLMPFGKHEICEYLNFRMREAGYKGPDIFNATIASAVEKYSCGLLRRINILADKALLAAFAAGTHNLRMEHIQRAANDSHFTNTRDWRMPLSMAASLLLGIIGGAGGFYFLGQKRFQSESEFAPATLSLSEANQTNLQVNSSAVLAAKAATATSNETNMLVQDEFIAEDASLSMDYLNKHSAYSITAWKQAAKQWVQNAPDRNFSIQLLTVAPTDAVNLAHHLTQFAGEIQLDKIYIYETKINAQPMLGVLYNDYSSRRSAETALENLPEVLRKNQPFLRTVGRLRSEITG